MRPASHDRHQAGVCEGGSSEKMRRLRTSEPHFVLVRHCENGQIVEKNEESHLVLYGASEISLTRF